MNMLLFHGGNQKHRGRIGGQVQRSGVSRACSVSVQMHVPHMNVVAGDITAGGTTEIHSVIKNLTPLAVMCVSSDICFKEYTGY